MNKLLSFILLWILPCCIFGQSIKIKKVLSHQDLVSWNKIKAPKISNNGDWVVYTLQAEEGDPTLKIYDAQANKLISFDHSNKAHISEDNQLVVFKISPPEDTLKALRRRKVEKNKLPKSKLGIYHLATGRLDTIDRVKNFKLPRKWSGWLAYLQADKAPQLIKKENQPSAKSHRKPKKKDSKNTSLHLLNLTTKEEVVFPKVLDYELAEKGKRFVFSTAGNDSTLLQGIYLFDGITQKHQPIWQQEGEYKNLNFDSKGTQIAFHANFDTTKALTPPYELFYWEEGMERAKSIANSQAGIIPNDWMVSPHRKPAFSEDGTKLFWGIAPEPIQQDTTLLDEEIVNVEVWHWQDAKLHPQQEVQKDRESKRSYTVVWHPATNKFIQLGALDLPETKWGDKGNAKGILAYNELPYYKEVSWEGGPAGKDVYIINSQTGTKKQIAKGVKGTVRLSPAGMYAYAWVTTDSAWYSYQLSNGKATQLTNNEQELFYDEQNDRPMHPRPAGMAGWIENDKAILIYDRYDIWKLSPTGATAPVRLTKGREKKQVYRYVSLDRENDYINSNEKLLLRVFDETTKESGYAWLDYATQNITLPNLSKHGLTTRPIKAKNADKIIFTKENFRTFPDLQYSDLDFKNPIKISDANPQQQDYNWGTMELFKWTSLDGQALEGLLVKPDNFDPNKKYPLLVNFYERSSHGLYRHRAPFPHRSTINYSFYASKGYVIFNPDVSYKIGYPGESCFNSVMAGVTALLKEGFIDKERMGIQGHSWGGYQIAYLLTKTDMFKCAESGAPVVNMFSAYGGIRWGSGFSRMFQYERTQSRIGGTIWEYPLRYIENSPIFEMDKTNTPVLILHNDKDGAVPWYQGIEYFVALRRLGKPAWLLNYNEEPHWPVKLQNRKDFNIRMQQYFDYYLMDAPMPVWMQRGVPALEKGIQQGLELIELRN